MRPDHLRLLIACLVASLLASGGAGIGGNGLAPATAAGLNDTGVILCANATVNDAACNDVAAGTDQYPGQDAEHGRDASASADADGRAGFSFIKLDNAGAPLPDQSAAYDVAPWSCIEDQVTGLTWEVSTDDDGLRDKDWRYSWYNSTGVDAARGNGIENGGSCLDSANCDTEKYLAAVNTAGLCGNADWRLPSRAELLSLVDYGGAAAPLVDAAFLPNSLGEAYWSASSDSTIGAWSVDFANGGSRAEDPATALPARLVRGGSDVAALSGGIQPERERHTRRYERRPLHGCG